MNKKHLADYLATNVLTPQRIEELLTDFLNAELAAKRPKIDLLGAGIVEPESLILPPLSKEQIEDAKKEFTFKPLNFHSEITVVTIEPEIKPEDMVSGEWYALNCWGENWVFKFKEIKEDTLHTTDSCAITSRHYFSVKNNDRSNWGDLSDIENLRRATREEVTKYFPNEFQIDRVTDEQL